MTNRWHIDSKTLCWRANKLDIQTHSQRQEKNAPYNERKMRITEQALGDVSFWSGNKHHWLVEQIVGR